MRKIVITALLSLVIFSIWYFYPKHYNETLEGVYYQLGDEKVFENIRLHIDGELRNHISGEKTFEGTVEFEGTSIPKIPEDRSELILYIEGGYGQIVSHFRAGFNGKAIPDIYQYGSVYTNNDFTQFTIAVYSRDPEGEHVSWSGKDGLMITVPAENRKEAIELSDKLMEE
jgi:hypothetical protein